MHVFSSSSPSSSSTSSNYTILSPQNSNPLKFNLGIISFKTLYPSSSHPLSNPVFSHDSSPSPLLQETPQKFPSQSDDNDEEVDIEVTEKIRIAKKSLEELLVVRRLVMEFYEEEVEEKNEDSEIDNVVKEKPSYSSLPFDANLSRFAEKMPIFEPERVQSVSGVNPLLVNLDLALYRAKILARNFQRDWSFKERG